MKRVDVTYVLIHDETKEKILMVKNKGENGSYYTLPGGAVEQGERLDEAAIREVKEETGLDVSVSSIVSISETFFKERAHHAIFFVFRGTIVGGEESIIYPDEIEEISWMDIDQVESLLADLQKIPGKEESYSVPYIFGGNR